MIKKSTVKVGDRELDIVNTDQHPQHSFDREEEYKTPLRFYIDPNDFSLKIYYDKNHAKTENNPKESIRGNDN